MTFKEDAYKIYLEAIESALTEFMEVRKLEHAECMKAISSAREKFDKVNEPALEELLKHRC